MVACASVRMQEAFSGEGRWLEGSSWGQQHAGWRARSSPWEANRRRNPPNTPNNMSAEDDDLYGDLATVTVKPATTSQLTFASKQSPVTPSEVGGLQQQVASLKEENETLRRNMGILYRTAKAELERKDKAIDRLQNELDGMKR